jgi:hypothetical protein
MEKFSEIVKKYNIKCYDKLFEKIVIKNFDDVKENIEEINSETLLIGIPFKIKIIGKLNILILGYELDNKKILEYLLRNKSRINFFSLSELNSNYYLKNFGVHSKTIHFDFNRNYERNMKLIYFNQNNNIEFENHSNNFINYIKESDNIFNIIELKIIIFEELIYIWDPYVNILYQSFSEYIKIFNFYQLNSSIYMKKFINLPKNVINKYIFFKINIEYIKNFVKFICKIPDEHKFLYSAKKYDNLRCLCKDIDNSFVIISDDIIYLESIVKKDISKIFISNEDICLIKNDIIHIHKKFILNEISNIREECKNISFIVEVKKDIALLQKYLAFYKKYLPKKNIKIFASPEMKINGSLNIKDFVVEENTKIYFSKDYPIDKYFNELILIRNIEIGFLDKINVLVSSTQYPNYGGAATNAYNIIRYLQSKNKEGDREEGNYNICGLFINNNTDNNVINPDNLENICGISYSNYNDPKIYYYLYKEYGSFPDIAFCKNCMAPKIIKKIFPNCVIIFLVSGIMGFSEIECGANEIKDYSLIQKKQEKEAILVSEVVLCNSQLTLDYYQKIYKDTIEKKNNLAKEPLDTTKYNTIHFKNVEPNAAKPIDIIIVASNVNRKVKNISFIKELLAFSQKLRNYKIIVIGHNSVDMFSGFEGVEILPLQKQEEVDYYLEKSKVILIPSLFDSNSNTFREAVMLSVIPIISVNVAHPRDYPGYFVVDNYKYEEWEKKIIYALSNFNKLRKNYDLKKCFENNDQIETYL